MTHTLRVRIHRHELGGLPPLFLFEVPTEGPRPQEGDLIDVDPDPSGNLAGMVKRVRWTGDFLATNVDVVVTGIGDVDALAKLNGWKPPATDASSGSASSVAGFPFGSIR